MRDKGTTIAIRIAAASGSRLSNPRYPAHFSRTHHGHSRTAQNCFIDEVPRSAKKSMKRRDLASQ